MPRDPSSLAAKFDDVIHAPLRMRICGLLRKVDKLDFSVARDTLGVSDAVLSKHVKTLLESGYVVIDKGRSTARVDARRITWLSLTPAGGVAFDAHMAEIRRIAAGLDV